MAACSELPAEKAVEPAPPAVTRFWQEMAARALTFGQQQYGDWHRERDALDGLIEEAEHDSDGQSGSREQEISSLALQATRARRARLTDLLVTHPEWGSSAVLSQADD
jgi:hypothetical protein